MRNFAAFALLFAVATIAVPIRGARHVNIASIEERNSAEWNEYTKAKKAKARNADTTLTKEWEGAEWKDYIEPKMSKPRDVDSVSEAEWSEDRPMEIGTTKE